MQKEVATHGKIRGVKPLIMLANVPDIKGSYENCMILWQLTGPDKRGLWPILAAVTETSNPRLYYTNVGAFWSLI